MEKTRSTAALDGDSSKTSRSSLTQDGSLALCNRHQRKMSRSFGSSAHAALYAASSIFKPGMRAGYFFRAAPAMASGWNADAMPHFQEKGQRAKCWGNAGTLGLGLGRSYVHTSHQPLAHY